MKICGWIPVVTALLAIPALGADGLRPPDLTPVTWMDAPRHAPVEIVRDGKAVAAVYVAEPKPGANLKRLIDELMDVVNLGAGATLERLSEPPAENRPAIVIGDGEASRSAGIDPAKIPPEGFVVKTAKNRIYLVGGAGNPDGTAWAVADVLERFAGVRWYWPAKAAGRSIPRQASISIPPVHYTDAPVCRRRIDFIETALMPLQTEGHNWADRLPLPLAPGVMAQSEDWWYMPGMGPLWRNGESLDFTPGIIQGSEAIAWWLALWAHDADVKKAGDAVHAVNQDGTRHPRWICFSAPETIEALLARLSRHWDEGARGWPPHSIMTDASCTVYFPGTPGLVCHCPRCIEAASPVRNDRTLKAALVREYGEERASEIVEARAHELVFGLFVKRLCESVAQRWPGKKVVFNAGEHRPPEGMKFPDNLRVACVWPEGFAMGAALHPSRVRAFEETVRGWGHVLFWAAGSSPGDWTYGPVQYPHLVRDFHLRNRDFITGSELTIFSAPILVSEAPTYYVWRKVLWNPELDVDATLDEMCRRLFGAGAGTARELLRLQCDRWERTPLSRPLHMEDLQRDRLAGTGGLGSLVQERRLPRDLFRELWPVETVARMKELRDRALTEIEASGDADSRRAFLYWTWTFDAFLEEAAAAHRRVPARESAAESGRPLQPVADLAPNLTLGLGAPAGEGQGSDVKLSLTLIRPGDFLMGSETNEWGHHRNESPLHRVRITKPFYMGAYEVTRAQYDAVMGTRTAGDAPNRPAASVSWRDATNFCARLSQATGRRVRLPTEAEWEYACRAGTATPWSFGDAARVEETIKDYAWYAAEAGGGPREGGGKKPNAWGLYDMHGNVSEWCSDRFGEDYYGISPTDDPAGPETGVFRVLRGGSADHLRRRNVELTRSARRAWGHPDLPILQRGMNHMYIGFRVVVEADGSKPDPR